MKVKFNLNGTNVEYEVRADEYLADALRAHGIYSVKVGCNESACGSCTVLINEKPVLSCSVLAASVEGKNVLTVEGIQDEAKRLADFIADEGADQCGYCLSGFALIVHALVREYKNPTDEQIKDFLVGNICRCSGYQAQLKAIKNYLKEVK